MKKIYKTPLTRLIETEDFCLGTNSQIGGKQLAKPSDTEEEESFFGDVKWETPSALDEIPSDNK